MANEEDFDLNSIDKLVEQKLTARQVGAPQQQQPAQRTQAGQQPQQRLETILNSDQKYVLSSRETAEKLARAVEQTKLAKGGMLTPEAMTEIGAYFGKRFEYFVRTVAKAYDAKSTLTADEIKKASLISGINFEDLAKEAAKAKDAKNQARAELTANETRGVGEILGVKLEDYAICHIPQAGQTKAEVFYVGNEKPVIRAKDMPLDLITLTDPETGMCPQHQAILAINSELAKSNEKREPYQNHKALVLELWEELDLQKTREQLARLAGIAQLSGGAITIESYTEVVPQKAAVEGEQVLRAGERIERKRQALVFQRGRYTIHQQYAILAGLRGKGEEVLEIPATPAQTQAYNPPKAAEQTATVTATPAVPSAAKPSSIDELLPKGSLKEKITEIKLKAIHNGVLYEFAMPVLLNEFMAIDGQEDYRLIGNSEIIFTGKIYLDDAEARKVTYIDDAGKENAYADAAAAREEVVRKLIGKDKRIRFRMDPVQQKNLEAALQHQKSLAAKQSLIKMTLEYISGQDSAQQTL